MAHTYGNMRTNGNLRYCKFTGAGFNEDGEPLSTSSKTWSEPIPCSIKTETNNSKGRYEDGKFNQATYTVLVEDNSLPLDTKRVKLERDGRDLGEFAVQGIPTPTIMGRIKIIV